MHEGVVALVRLVHNMTDQAAREHGPVRWLLLRALSHLFYWDIPDSLYYSCSQGGYDMDMECYDGTDFPNGYHVHRHHIDLGLQEGFDGDDLSKEKYQSMHDSYDSRKGFERGYEKEYAHSTPDMWPSYPEPSPNPDQVRR